MGSEPMEQQERMGEQKSRDGCDVIHHTMTSPLPSSGPHPCFICTKEAGYNQPQQPEVPTIV